MTYSLIFIKTTDFHCVRQKPPFCCQCLKATVYKRALQLGSKHYLLFSRLLQNLFSVQTNQRCATISSVLCTRVFEQECDKKLNSLKWRGMVKWIILTNKLAKSK